MDDAERIRPDALFNLLADEVAKRIEERSIDRTAEQAPPQSSVPPETASPTDEVRLEASPEGNPEGEDGQADEPLAEPAPEPPLSAETPVLPHAASLVARLLLGLFIIVALINIPFDTQGKTLARAFPSSASLVIRNGLVVKETASPDIWVYRDSAFHWITSLDAFQHFGYRWQDVHLVEPGFLNQFDKGSPIYVLLKCSSSPHIYRLEEGRKRWIADIPTFQAEKYAWTDVKIVPCQYLHGLPDGESIPPGRGSPPPPLP